MSPLEQTLTQVRDALAEGNPVGAARMLTDVEKLLNDYPTAKERELFAVCSELLRRTMDSWRTRAASTHAVRAAIGAYQVGR